MFLAAGVGAYTAGMFHLYTHAFFKALLFLCAGSVMHAMSGELDLQKMGGLWKYMPITYWTMLFASLSIAGMPGFAGFFSKDEILWLAYSGQSPESGKFVWAVGDCCCVPYSLLLIQAYIPHVPRKIQGHARTGTSSP